MSLREWIGRRLGFHTPPTRAPDRRDIKGRFDAAQTTDGNYRHWANADFLSARAAHDPWTRSKLRSRSRYECANSGYFQGLVQSIAQDTIGSGPRLQLTLPDNSPDQARMVERAWADWCNDETVDLATKLRIAKESELRDGESFILLTTNPAIASPVKLDLQLIEADQCGDFVPLFGDPRRVDGIVFDDHGNPAFYHFLPHHPGDDLFAPYGVIIEIPAADVIHWFRASRPGTRRGVPMITPALPVGAILRRYCLATLEAAELAANLAGVMKTSGLPDDGTQEIDVLTYDKIPLERGTLLSLPEGWDATQFKPEQPTANYRDFKGENLDEIGRSVHAPSNVIRGNSREYNFSSGRLDYTLYHRAVKLDRKAKERRGINRIFRAWVAEARNLPRYLPGPLPPIDQWRWTWYWDGFESIDPVKDATAARMLLQDGFTTYAEYFAEDGKDWEEVFAQQKREQDLLAELGLPPRPTDQKPAATAPATPTGGD